jgi:pyruvate carboxylase subunit B
MTEYEARVAGNRQAPAAGWQLVLDDPTRGVGRLVDGQRSIPVIVEGRGSTWTVTIRGRRVPVEVLTWRERLLAEAETESLAHDGPVIVKATLPGLIVAVAVDVGHEVDAGATLLTIEAMKMQNEVRAPRGGRVVEVAVASGQAVATGAPLVRIE